MRTAMCQSIERRVVAALLMVALALTATATVSRAQKPVVASLERVFEQAVAAYNAGNFLRAIEMLDSILPATAENYQVQELMGLSCAAAGRDEEAHKHLDAAATLNPGAAEAHVNLAANLSRMGQQKAAIAQLRKASALEPDDASVNRNLGAALAQQGSYEEARVYLERAQTAEPSVENGMDLAQADLLSGHVESARQVLNEVSRQQDSAMAHNLLGQVDEQQGKYVEAANEFAKAAEMEPTEDNLFDWGSELLLHRTDEPATRVFAAAIARYPKSVRLYVGLGMSYYGRGLYEDAVKALLTATDFGEADPRCYLFLAKAYDSSPSQATAVMARFERYAKAEPGNAEAQYYYAMSLWKGKRTEDATLDLTRVQALLERAIALDGHLTEAHMALGSLYADEHLWEKAIAQFEAALAQQQNLPDAHYRLGTAYMHTGRKVEAQREFGVYQQQRAAHLAEVDKERAAVQQFIYDNHGGHEKQGGPETQAGKDSTGAATRP